MILVRDELVFKAPVNGSSNYDKVVVVKVDYMLEQLVYLTILQLRSDNLFSGVNQQERSRSTGNPQRLYVDSPDLIVGDDIVRPAWRHADYVINRSL